MSIDRFAEDNHLVVDDEVYDYLAHLAPCDQVNCATRPTCGEPLDQVTKCFLDPGHSDGHCGLRPNGTLVRWSNK